MDCCWTVKKKESEKMDVPPTTLTEKDDMDDQEFMVWLYDHYEERMRQPAIAFSLNEMEEQDSLPALAKEDSAEKQRFSDLVKGCPRLTEKETYVLEQVYYWGYTAAELAPGMGTSKQNVNQIKLRALGKLRQQWETEK